MEPTFGVMLSIIVRANTEERARQLTSSRAYGEGKEIWLDANKTSCHELLTEGIEEVILESTSD